MNSLSVVIITYNEERNIQRCLDSLEGIADEIVIVDSFSTDKTELCSKRNNVMFVQQQWLGYSEQKNYGNNITHHNWILSVDADEVLSETLRMSVLEWKKQQWDASHAFSINRLTNYCGHWIRHCGWYPDTKMRLFNKTNASWKGDIHEIIEFSQPVNMHLLKGDLLHYSYHTLEDHIRQADKFTTMTAQKAFSERKKASLWAILFRPCWKFIRDYIFKGGFLDGYAGFLVCKISAFATFLKYTKLRSLNESKNDSQNDSNK